MTTSRKPIRSVALAATTLGLGVALAVPPSATAASSSSHPSSSSSSASASSSSSAKPDQGAQRKGQCISEREPLSIVSNGVSHAQAELDFTSLWDLSKGDGISVGIIDSGVNSDPNAFGNRLVGGGDLVAPQEHSNGLQDCDGHGTLVAGIIGASPDRSTGFSGIAPDVKLISIRQSSAMYHGSGDNDVAGDDKSLAKAIDSAVGRGVRVINISTDSCNPAASQDNPDLVKSVKNAYDKNVVVVVAAGNVGSESCTNQNTPGRPPVTRAQPADLPQALTVGALSETGQASSFSLAGPWVKVAAPGEGIISTNPQWGRGGQVSTVLTDQGPTAIAGTSFAAPYVTGVVALVRARFPQLSAAQVMHRIEVTANHVGQGQNPFVGYGLLNPRRALTAVLPEEGNAGAPVSLAHQESSMAPPRHLPQDLLARRLAGSVAALVALGLALGAGMLAARRRRERLAAQWIPRKRALRRRRRRQRMPSA